jgi:hypothetical protein
MQEKAKGDKPNANAPQESAEHFARRLLPIPTIMSAEQNPATLDAKVLETAADIHVFNDQGDEVRFGDIFTDSKTVIVFIRARTFLYCMYSFTPLPDGSVYQKGISSVG